MYLEKLFGENLTPEVKEILTLLLSEQMSRLSRKEEKKNPEKYQEINETLDQWEQMVKEMSPELEEKNREFLDWLIGWHGDELESYYLSGFCDGIRLFRWIMKL